MHNGALRQGLVVFDASKLPDDRHRCRCARLQLAKLASDREQTVIILNASQLFDNRATIDVRLPPPECLRSKSQCSSGYVDNTGSMRLEPAQGVAYLQQKSAVVVPVVFWTLLPSFSPIDAPVVRLKGNPVESSPNRRRRALAGDTNHCRQRDRRERQSTFPRESPHISPAIRHEV